MSLDYVNSEIARMEEEGFLTREECMGIRPEKIYAFFATEEGKALCAAPKVLREFKFSILVDAQSREPSMIGEKILLQGVVDCAMVEDSITVVDFKTDHVTKDSLEAATRRYAPQIRAYGKAMEKNLPKASKEKATVLFPPGSFCRSNGIKILPPGFFRRQNFISGSETWCTVPWCSRHPADACSGTDFAACSGCS